MESILLIVMALADCGDGWYTGFAAQHIVSLFHFNYVTCKTYSIFTQ
jgi:hypothetical protein